MSALGAPFRDATAIVEREADALEARHRDALAALLANSSLHVRRTARIAAGVAGTAMAAIVVLSMACRTKVASVTLLFLAWPVMLAAHVVAMTTADRVRRHRLSRALLRTADPFRDHGALVRVDLHAIDRALARRHARASYAWPLLAITLLAPHTLQVLFACAVGWGSASKLGEWMAWSGALASLVFLYGVWAAWTFPRTQCVWGHIGWSGLLAVVPSMLFLWPSGRSKCGLPFLLPPMAACGAAAVAMATAAVVALVAYRPMRSLMAAEAAQDAAEAMP